MMRMSVPVTVGALAQAPAQTEMSQADIFDEVVMSDPFFASSLYTNIMLAGLTLLAIAYIARGVSDPRAKLIVVSCMMISAVSVASYTGLFSGMTISVLEMPPGHALAGEEAVSLWGRYLTWALSTPFILLALGLVAGSNLTKIFTAIVFDVGIMVTGLAAALTTSSYALRWFWYLVSVTFFIVVVYILLAEWPEDARRTGTVGIFNKLKILTVVLWFGYTVWWGVGNEGLALVESVALTSWGYSILDIVAKYAFSFLVVLYVVDEPDEVTGGEDWGSLAPSSGADG